MRRVHIIVHGDVQGVFFRANTVREAKNLGIRGYAKNLNDGTVEIIAEGNEGKINDLIDFCKNSPGASEVSEVNVKFGKFMGEFDDFSVRY